MTKENFFFCYDRKLMMHLKSHGFRFIFCAKHEISDNKFWLFEQSDRLAEAIGCYKK